jgi:hypothetical protein
MTYKILSHVERARGRMIEMRVLFTQMLDDIGTNDRGWTLPRLLRLNPFKL